ncbi:MAG: alpha/beta hydrolase [Marinosulfonomonas sp.]|nr:alpha/beta hydrolase [Marinosulfonomonas sp.]
MSWQLRVLGPFLKNLIKPLVGLAGKPSTARKIFAVTAKSMFHTPPFSLMLAHAGGPGGLWISNGPVKPSPVLLYFHGGGYIVGSPQSHQGMLARLSQLSNIRVFAPNYRLAPDAGFPAQIEDAVTAWQSLLARGYMHHNIILGGDSAGGGLALSLLALMCQGGQPPAGCFVFSPWTDLSLSGGSLQSNRKADHLLPVARIAELRDMILQGADPTDPRASPLYASFPNCPPVFLQVSETEILLDDTLRMADRLRGEGGEVIVDLWPDLPHVAALFQGFLPEADQSLSRVAKFIGQLQGLHPAADS